MKKIYTAPSCEAVKMDSVVMAAFSFGTHDTVVDPSEQLSKSGDFDFALDANEVTE